MERSGTERNEGFSHHDIWVHRIGRDEVIMIIIIMIIIMIVMIMVMMVSL